MLDTLRKPLFIVALALALVTVLLEVGSAVVKSLGNAKIGLGIPYSPLLDGLLLFTILLMGVGLLLPERVTGRIQGVATLLVSLLIGILSFVLILAAIAALVEMVTLLVAVPFGTIVYLILFGGFNRSGAAIALSLIMMLKLVFAGCLVLAHQRFLENKGLVLLILTSLLATLIIGFLQGMVPGFLVSITDAIAAIVVGILALLWAVWFVLRSIPAVVKAVA
ncbi:MAG TPA: hypothetical protein VMT20_12725 [Terriglobia bacterium]|nr:hypothetical protein [Terriglobia bacterium]